MIQTSFLLVLGLILPHHLATSCQVYPSEYAYHKNAVVGNEQSSVNCMSYSSGLDTKNVARTEDYNHCDGSPLRLTDSDFGSDQSYISSDYYVWSIGASTRQLLFIFAERFTLTIITLHYKSDSVRGLPNLKFYAVPDDFEVWHTPIAKYSFESVTAVTPGGESAGLKNVSTNFNFNTRRVLMVSLSNAFEFAVSEVEFFTCSVTTTSTSEDHFNNTNTSPKLLYTTVSIPETLEVNKTTIEPFQNNTSQNIDQFIPENSQLDIVLPVVLTAAIIATIVLVVLFVILLLTVYCKRKRNLKTKFNVEMDTTYATLDRGTTQQMKPESTDTSADLYNQIQLSPSTGQSEPISESKHVIGFTSSPTLEYHNMKRRQERDTEKSNTENATYAVVDKKKSKKEELNESPDKASERVCPQKHQESLKDIEPVESGDVEKPNNQQSQRKDNLEEMYAVVQKKPKKCEEQEEMAPPLPSHTIESLYTAVEKKPK